MMKANPVVVIGAGAAGLAAAEVLVREGRPVTLLEGRNRIGGRIHTLPGQGGMPPIELGAEFIHGENVCTWEMIRAAGLATQLVTDRHWWFTDGALTEEPGFWEELEHVSGKVNDTGPDSDVATFLAQAPGLSASARTLAKEYVEGFHAAPVDRMSVHAFAQAEGSGEGDEGMKQFRLTHGYSALLDWFGHQLAALGVEIRLETVVRRVGWERGRVEIVVQTPTGPQSFEASQAVVTLPLGVLQAQGPEAVVFEPRLEAKEKAIQGLGVGAVVKLTLQFESRFWPVEDFGFIHAPDAAFPTWWSDARGPVVTGWVGGPRAQRLVRESREALVAKALRALAGFFQADVKRVQALLVAGSTYDWLGDPFARGAYSFPPVGVGDIPKLLAAPLFDTLFFAGEATDPEGDLGTVHGALASGGRAAREVLAVKPL